MKFVILIVCTFVFASCASNNAKKSKSKTVTVHDQVKVKKALPDFLSKQQIKWTLKQHQNQVNDCYKSIVEKKGDVRGLVFLSFLIEPKGNVSEIKVTKNSTGSEQLGACLQNKLKAIQFDESLNRSKINYPFRFHGLR